MCRYVMLHVHAAPAAHVAHAIKKKTLEAGLILDVFQHSAAEDPYLRS